MLRRLLLMLCAGCSAEVPPAFDAGQIADVGPADAGTQKDAAPDAADAEVLDVGFVDAGPADTGVVEMDAGMMMPPPGRRPIIFVHGIGGMTAEFDVLIGRLVDDGWAPDQMFPIQFDDPRWGCNIDNAQTIADVVDDVLAMTGVPRVDIVAHSMGTLSSRYFVKNLGGVDVVNTYVTLGGLHHGNNAACLNPLPVCVWEELCPTNPFLSQLNEEPATPGDLYWVSIYSTDDTNVPTTASHLDGAENIEVMGPTHAGSDGLLEHPVVYPELLRVLEYPDL